MKRTNLTRRRPLLRKKRLSALSPKKQRERKIYRAKSAAFLRAHPRCQAYDKIISWLFWSDKDLPVALLRTPRSEEIHHIKGRGKYYLDESAWLAVCRWSHDWIGANPKIAEQLGLLSPERNTGRGMA